MSVKKISNVLHVRKNSPARVNTGETHFAHGKPTLEAIITTDIKSTLPHDRTVDTAEYAKSATCCES